MLPNSPNVIMAAERAAELSEKHVRVLLSRSQQAGLAVAVALEPAAPPTANAVAMEDELAHVRTGAVAARPATTPPSASAPARPSASWRRSWWRGASRGDAARVLGALGDGAELLTSSPATARRWTASGSPPSPPTASSSSTRTAASPAGGGWSRPSSDRPRRSHERGAIRRAAASPCRRAARPRRRLARRARALAAPVAARRAAEVGPPRPAEGGRAPGPGDASAICSSTCRATAARRARSPSSRPSETATVVVEVRTIPAARCAGGG